VEDDEGDDDDERDDKGDDERDGLSANDELVNSKELLSEG
jgi:hypothetical protein